MTQEEILHKDFLKAVNLKYPNVMFITDTSGIKLPSGLAKKIATLRSNKGFPDVFFPEPVGAFCGLFIEIKTKNAYCLNKNGNPVNEHIKSQLDVLHKLRDRGYYAVMCKGFDNCWDIFEAYITDKLNYDYYKKIFY